MKPLRTLLLVVLALGMFAYIALYERHETEPSQAAGTAPMLFANFNPALVASVEVSMLTNQSLRVERTNNTWLLVHPLVYPAHALRVDRLLSIFSQLTRSSHISAQELTAQRQPLSAFGLDPPRATVVVQHDLGRLELKIGNRTPLGSQVYVQLVGSDGIYFTDAAVLDRLPRSVDEWRDPGFLPLKGLAFNRLKIEARAGGGVNVLQFETDPATRLWRLTGPMAARADNAKLEQLIGQLQTWQIRSFVSESPKPDLEIYGLQTPELTLVFGRGSNDLLMAQFGKSPPNDNSLIYARCLGRTGPVLVDKELVAKLRVPFSEFRERRLTSAGLGVADLVEVRGQENFTLQRQKDGSWWTHSPQPQLADPQLVMNFFANITALRIADFERDEVTEDYSSWGLNRPRRQYLFRQAITNVPPGVTNRLLAQLDFGTNKADKIYARVQGENSVYTVKLEAYALLPSQSFQLWDRRLWSFDTNDVTTVTIQLMSYRWKLVRNAARQWSLAPATTALEFPVPNMVDEVIYRLGRLQAVVWTAQGDDKLATYGIPDADAHLEIEVSPTGKPVQHLTLDFGPSAPSQNIFASAKKNGRRLIFEISRSLFDLYGSLLQSLPRPPTSSADHK